MNVFPGLPADRAALGTWIKLPAIESIELMAEAGMDLVVIDLEHSSLSIETASMLTSVALGRGLVPFVRIPDQSPTWIQRCLDFGAHGIVVPHVDSLDQALRVRSAARFEPRGRRGMGPTSRAGAWNLRGPADYVASAERVKVIVQIESAAGVAALSSMLAQQAVDGVLVGAADLSMSLGLAMDHPQVVAHMLEVLDQCLANDVPCAIAGSADGRAAAEFAHRGFSAVIAGNDATMLGAAARAVVDSAGIPRPVVGTP